MTQTDEIYVLNKRLKLTQIGGGFRTSMDSVFLAASTKLLPGQKLLDMGCGVGGAGLCALKRIEGIHLTGIDIQKDHIECARDNAQINNMSDRAEFLTIDIRDYDEENMFDAVICNPPYLEAGTHLVSPSVKKAKALGHEDESLNVDVWLDRGFRALKQSGILSMIHRADHVDKIIRGMKNRFGGVEIIPLWPHMDEAAKRVIVRAVKGRKSPAILHPGIVLHEENGDYTRAAQNVLREMQAL